MPATHPSRATVAVLAIVLALATALALTATAVTLASPAAGADSSAANQSVVRRFYAALNLSIATGDLTELDSLVSPDLVVGDGTATGRAALDQHLLALHAVQPNLWLGIEETLVDGDRVIARIAVDGLATGVADPTALLSLPAPGSSQWTTGDRLRVVDGRVAAFAGLTLTLAPAHALLDAVIAAPPIGQGWLGLARLTADPWADIVAPPAAGPYVYLVESGAVSIQLDDEGERRYSAGEQFIVASGVSLALRNASSHPATLLTAAIVPPAAPWPPRFDQPVDVNSIAPLDLSRPVPTPPSASSKTAPTAAVQAVSLGGSSVVPSRLGLAGNLRLTLAHLAPAPGQNLLALGAEGTIMLTPDSGRALLSASTGTDAADDTLLSGGRAAMHPFDATLTVQPAGDEPLGLLVLSLTTS